MEYEVGNKRQLELFQSNDDENKLRLGSNKDDNDGDDDQGDDDDMENSDTMFND